MWVDLLGASVGFRGQKYRTRVIEAGEGEPLILLHGNGGHAEAWSRNVLRLSTDFHVLAIDLMWHGLSSGAEFTTEMVPTYAEQVVDLLDELGAESAYVEGESLGGWVAMWLALHHSSRVKKIVLNTTAGAALEGDPSASEAARSGTTLRERSLAAIRDGSYHAVRARLEFLMAKPDRVTDELVAIRQAFYQRQETRANLLKVTENSFTGESPHRITPDLLAKIPVPTLVLWSDHNPGTGPEYGKRLADAIPDASFACIEDAGHWSQWEQPVEHDAIVTRFLKE